MRLQVNKQQRMAKMRAHTATHLLHYCLDQILAGTKQSGSVVDDDLLRFDFATREPLSIEQISQIEQQINDRIAAGSPLTIEETDLESAKSRGAKAFFEDKYGEVVRVVSVDSSVELCGGTHVANTADIGAFKIINQESVASGIRRIVAVTGPQVARQYSDFEAMITQVAATIGATPKQLPEKIEKMQKELDTTRSDYEGLKSSLLSQMLSDIPTSTASPFDYLVNAGQDALKSYNFKDIVNVMKSVHTDHSWIVYNDEGMYAISTTDAMDITAKAYAQKHALKGGGADHFMQGKDPALLALISK